MSRGRAEAALAANTLVWGCTFVLVKAALVHVSAVLFIALRFGVAAVALLVLFRSALRAPITRGMLGGGALTGVFLFLGYFFQTVGLQYTTPTKSAFITGLTTVLVPFFAAIVYKNRPRFSELVGILVATVGMGLLTLEGPFGSIRRGDLLTLLGAAAFAAHIVTLGHFSESMGFELLSVAQVSASALSALMLFWWVEPVRLDWQPLVFWAILITGLLCTALAFTVQAWAQRYTSSTRTALIYALEPVFAWVTSFLILGESLSGRAAGGAVLILAGVLLVELKPFQTNLHPS
ncbi:MAG: DMT family transporter [Acidobacteria bacterium]|nr:DMT family transporter [Acidobacteriota bacterium]